MKKITWLIVIAAFSISFTSCATIISGRMQQIPVMSNPSGATVTMGNIKQKTPAALILDRKMTAYELLIEKDGYEPITIVLKKGVNGWVFGNLIFGGWIGIIVDIVSGSASAFKPSEIQVNLIEKELGSRLIKGKDILIVKLKEEM